MVYLMRHYTWVLFAFFALALLPAPMRATSIFLDGTFYFDDNLAEIEFLVGQTSTVDIKTLSHAGSVNPLTGIPVVGGGFYPILTLFSQVDTIGLPTSSSGLGPDGEASIDMLLNPGVYTLVVSEDDNIFPLSDSATFVPTMYSHYGQGNFTSIYGCPKGQFCEFPGDPAQRTGYWALDIDGTDRIVPEPGGLLLCALGVAVGGLWLRFRRWSVLSTAAIKSTSSQNVRG